MVTSKPGAYSLSFQIYPERVSGLTRALRVQYQPLIRVKTWLPEDVSSSKVVLGPNSTAGP